MPLSLFVGILFRLATGSSGQMAVHTIHGDVCAWQRVVPQNQFGHHSLHLALKEPLQRPRAVNGVVAPVHHKILGGVGQGNRQLFILCLLYTSTRSIPGQLCYHPGGRPGGILTTLATQMGRGPYGPLPFLSSTRPKSKNHTLVRGFPPTTAPHRQKTPDGWAPSPNRLPGRLSTAPRSPVGDRSKQRREKPGSGKALSLIHILQLPS